MKTEHTDPTDLSARVEEALAKHAASETDESSPRAEYEAVTACMATFPALAADWQRLRERERALTEALRDVHDWRGLCDSDAVETFERIASMFHAETGYLRPGKDCRLHDRETRQRAWGAWVQRKNDELDARIRAALSPEPKT